MGPPITILMASYNGARYLPAQLDSILAQSWRDWRLLVSDDGSSDATAEILSHYAHGPAQGRLQVISGPGRGATANFLHLLTQADPQAPVAFADQDDFWQPDKLARAMAWLAQQNGPAVYAARTTICDQDLKPLNPAPHFPGPFGFRNALVQACLPGNTTVANPQALSVLQAAAPAAMRHDIVAHDWWVYQVMSGIGATLRRDPAQVLLYRQHPRNVMGRNDTTLARAARFGMLFDGSFAGWLARNQAALDEVNHLFTKDSRELLDRFGALLCMPGPAAFRQARKMGLYRQSRSGTAAILLAAATGRLRPGPITTAPT